MTDVLLTYGWVRSTYAALRNLSAHGLEVSVSDSYRTGMCQASLLKKTFDVYPSHYEDEEGFVSAIEQICRKRRIELILPSHNETEVLARHRSRFPGRLSALFPKVEHCALFNNKARAYDLVQSLGIPLPSRVSYQRPDSVAQAIRDSGVGRTVVKLLTGNSAKGVFYADDPDAAQRLVEQLVADYDLGPDRYPQIEEFVEGDGWGSSVLYWHGQPIAAFSHRRLREKIESGGTSTLREAVEHPGLEAAAARIFGALGWHGLAMAEFKVCPVTGRFWFIEVNPRMWGSISLAIGAGVEFPYLAWLCASQGPEAARSYQAARKVKHSWRSRWLLGDATVALRELLHARPDKAIRVFSEHRVDALDDLYWNDPLVFAGELMRYGLSAISKRSFNAGEKGMVG